MKFIFHKINKLVVHIIPIKYWMIGILFFGSSVIFLLTFDNYSTLHCVRTSQNQGTCTLMRYSPTKTETLDFTLSDLISARVKRQVGWFEEESFVIMLSTTKGEISINQNSSGSYSEHTRIAEKINVFLADPSQTSLDVKQSSRLLMVFFSVFICLVGMGNLLLSRRVVVSLDSEQGLASIRRKNVFNRDKEEIPLGKLVKADMEKTIDGNKYRVTFVHQNGKRTPLTKDFSNNYKGASKIADEINQFLGVNNQRVSLR